MPLSCYSDHTPLFLTAFRSILDTFGPTCLCQVPLLLDPTLPSNFTSEANLCCNDNSWMSKPWKAYYPEALGSCLGKNMHKPVCNTSAGALRLVSLTHSGIHWLIKLECIEVRWAAGLIWSWGSNISWRKWFLSHFSVSYSVTHFLRQAFLAS